LPEDYFEPIGIGGWPPIFTRIRRVEIFFGQVNTPPKEEEGIHKFPYFYEVLVIKRSILLVSISRVIFHVSI
jgi:hypothetical protein